MTSAAWGFMGVIWATIFVCISISMKKIVKDQK
ncbi:Hypothetical protein RLITU_0131 [Romboutsia lituseburensis]|uniref:Uncharacterized protein n=1 Tax=Romboutsia lituseburensis DSM 797 TaxID=1121325 RepID=A0A1G9RKU4_9FIRM|nr:Hypothetical protein RLITU_0131 [Romboutsia lituseburensis]SDM23771.1 hypothetical protein SAMN04515677_10740 [Romboutsia lituseburensis DSM 797]